MDDTANPVIIEWTDTQTAKMHDGWLPEADFNEWCNEPLVVCRSIGFLTFENDEFVVISQTLLFGDRSDSTKIPKAIIKSMVTLKEN
jgi:hypothetical protein